MDCRERGKLAIALKTGVATVLAIIAA